MREAVTVCVVLAIAGAAASRLAQRGDEGPAIPDAEKDAPLVREADAPWRGTFDLSVRLLDAEERPVPHARVRVRNFRAWPGEPAIPPITTDSEGRFSLRGLGVGFFGVSMDTETGEQSAYPSLSPAQGPVNVRLRPPERPPDPLAATRVTGPYGKPIPQADVLPRWGSYRSPLTAVRDGVFFRTSRWDRTVYEVFAARDADSNPLPFGPALWEPELGDRPLSLPVGKALEGEVVDADGKGVFGAEVVAHPKTGDNVWSGIRLPDAHGRTTTDARGRFRFISLGDGPYFLRVYPLPPHLAPDVVEVAVATTDTRVRVVPGVEADITVLDRDGVPLLGAVVSGGVGRGASLQVTDALGRVHLSQIDPAAVEPRLTVEPPRSRPDLGRFSRKWTPADTTVRLERAWRLYGTVQREDGTRALSYLHVRMSDGQWRYVGPTRIDGSFELRNQVAGPWVLAASPSPKGPIGPEVRVTDFEKPVEMKAPREPAASIPAPAK